MKMEMEIMKSILSNSICCPILQKHVQQPHDWEMWNYRNQKQQSCQQLAYVPVHVQLENIKMKLEKMNAKNVVLECTVVSDRRVVSMILHLVH